MKPRIVVPAEGPRSACDIVFRKDRKIFRRAASSAQNSSDRFIKNIYLQPNRFFACKAAEPVHCIIEQKINPTVNETILFRYIKGETTPEEDMQVALWMERDPENHQRELDRIRFLYHFSLLHGPEIEHQIGRQRPRMLSLRRLARHAVRVAAAVVLLAAGAYTARYKIYDEITAQTTVFQVPYGQRVELTLPDGSAVWLNSGARIEYPAVFRRDARQVRLEGEAYFEVSHDAARPFSVETFASRISVLGTRFNVVADEAHDRFTTTLLEGRVQVTNRVDPSQPDIIMKPNDIVNLSNGRMRIGTLADDEALCWTQGLVSIGGLAFDELMAKFERVFDVKIVIARPTLPRIGRISGKIRVNDGIDNALHILQYAADFTYERDAETNTVTIR